MLKCTTVLDSSYISYFSLLQQNAVTNLRKKEFVWDIVRKYWTIARSELSRANSKSGSFMSVLLSKVLPSKGLDASTPPALLPGLNHSCMSLSLADASHLWHLQHP